MNALEELLQKAATAPEFRPAFYETLLASTVYVIGTAAGIAAGQPLPAGSQLQITHWQKEDGSQLIPFFSSLALLQQNIRQEESYLALNARDFFTMVAQGEIPLLLNPNADYGKEFFIAEIQALLAQGVNRLSQARVTETESQVLLGVPARKPEAIMAALSAFFGSQPAVRAAYVASIHDATRDEKPNLLIGLTIEGEGAPVERLIQQAGQIAGDLLPEGESLDIVRMVPGEHGISKYLHNRIAPFYERDPSA